MREQLQALIADLKGWWRFRWRSLIVAWLVCVIGWAVVYTIPDSYKSEAKVYVDTSSALRPLLEKMTVNIDVMTRLEQVTTAMLGRAQLEKVARETDLHLRAATPGNLDGVVAGLRQRIRILNDRRGDPNLFTIEYTDPDPETARSVVKTLLNNFVEDSLGENRIEAQKAQQFLREQLAELDAELSAAEDELADFKRANVGRMPGADGDYFSRLQTEIDALEDTRNELRLAQRRREALLQQLAGETPTMNGSMSVQSEVDRRIAESESQLAELRLRFTDRHPDVIALVETIERLKAQKQSEIDALMAAGGTGVATDNPVFQNIQMELTAVNVEIATLNEQVSKANAEIADLRGLIDVLPKVEAELKRLTRDYDVKLTQYQALLSRLEVAELSESAEQSEDVQFRVIEPPVLPNRPAAPNRPLLLGLVLLAGFGAAGGLAFLLNQLNPVFSTPKALREATGLPVLGGVQIIRTADRQRWRRTQVLSFATGVVVLVAVFAVVLINHDTGSDLVQAMI